VRDENGDLLADSHNILYRWKNYYSQLLNIRRVSDGRQIEVHTPEQLVPDLSPFDVETAIAKSKSYKLSGSEQIPAELIQAGGEILRSEIHKLINSIWNKDNCLISGRSLLLYRFARMMIKLTVIFTFGYHCNQLHSKYYQISFSQG
jgi:hypothetical protein